MTKTNASDFSSFEVLLLRSNNELGTSVLLILAWLAASDGSIDQSEANKLAQISEASKHGHDIQPILRLAKERDLDALQLAAEIVQKHFRGEKGKLFMEMAVGMAIEDGYLLPSENYILRFLADLLGLSSAELNAAFTEVTDRDMPDPSDPSEADYWKAREENSQRQSRSGSGSSHHHASAPRSEKAIRAFATLGLEYGASTDEVKRAYRHLAQVHHPDRFSPLGDESVAVATSTFQRIKAAYDYLMANA
ncbi:MAG: DnaJ domain-containing protein [Gammaproteobacteria bacterium]